MQSDNGSAPVEQQAERDAPHGECGQNVENLPCAWFCEYRRQKPCPVAEGVEPDEAGGDRAGAEPVFAYLPVCGAETANQYDGIKIHVRVQYADAKDDHHDFPGATPSRNTLGHRRHPYDLA